jgi:Ni2+-binding GTPase involved in maturation of urease and hydrogenase
MAELQQVFKTGGVPTVTFVRPLEYPKIILNLKTAGRGLVIEGPSGIGKTTAIMKAVAELELTNKVVRLSARKREDVEYISIVPETKNFGIVLIDDFHILPDEIKANIADIVKVLADEEAEQSKLIVVGINEAGSSLIKFAPDLVNRLDIIRFENSSDDKVSELVQKGENELNVRINVKDDIVKEANGGFYIAQMLCSEICEREGILKTAKT